MTISVEKLSLLSSLEPLRHALEVSQPRQDQGFADKLDRMLASGDVTGSTATTEARKVAAALTMQMLQSSLTLSGDPVGVASTSAALPLAGVLMQAYRANSTETADLPGREAQAVTPSPQRRESVAPPVADTVSVRPQRLERGDSSWLEPILEKASQKYGVDVGLIKAVIKAESNFNPHAVSHAGARGLMQLMPATARSLGVNDSFDPEQNVMAGTRFLKDMLNRYHGNLDAALAAYNWGPGNVDRKPDHLPRETRDYQARVKQLYSSYSS